jgi:cellulose synthase/poly-beta-1,6-N-acetylglucosamine synthase-like glycosyltransferase
MDYYMVIPAHNEEVFLESTLNSVLKQSLLPKKVILVNDNSTDGTEVIIDSYLQENIIFQKLNTISTTAHMPGSKVINAFNKGLELLDDDYDFIVKLDADVILPANYFEIISTHFKNDSSIGICGGFIYEQTSAGYWELNHPMDNDHIRGAFKGNSRT